MVIVAVVRISRSEAAAAAPARSTLTCAGQTFAEVVLKAITAGAVNHWGLAAMGRCRIASRTAPHPHKRPAVPRYRRQSDASLIGWMMRNFHFERDVQARN